VPPPLSSLPEKEQQQAAKALQRHVEVSRIVTQNPVATVEEGATWLEALVQDLTVPGLGRYGVKVRSGIKRKSLTKLLSSCQGLMTRLSCNEKRRTPTRWRHA
jgi:hypothetical protein